MTDERVYKRLTKPSARRVVINEDIAYEPQHILEYDEVIVDHFPAYVCVVQNAGDTTILIIAADFISGYMTGKDEPLWTADHMLELTKYVSKSLAAECVLMYEELLESTNQEGTL